MSSLRVLLCGGERFEGDQHSRVWAALDQIHDQMPIGELVTGSGGRGRGWARDWCALRGVRLRVRGGWLDRLGHSVGERNQKILDTVHPDVVLAVRPSEVADDMMGRAAAKGIPVVQG